MHGLQVFFMAKMIPLRRVVGCVLAAWVAAGCQVSKSSNPLSPNISGPITGVVISTPNALEPGQDWQIRMSEQPVKLMFQNADTSGERTLFYTIEIASDAAFKTIIYRRTNVAAGNVRTTVQLPDTLPAGQTYWWRVRAEDGANSGDYSKPVSFVAVAPVTLGAPTAVSPSGGITTLTPEFKVRPGSRTGPYERIVYTVQVANNQSFSSIAATFVVDETGTETTIAQNYAFLNDRTYYWRAQARDTGESRAVSPWSSVRTFETDIPAPSAPEPPSGGGGGTGPGPANAALCGPPSKTTPLAILQCHRSRYPETMSPSQAVAFLKASARDFNRAGVSGGPFGVLVKDSGNNCLGYSCDIICAGQGNDQRQYDVLVDEKYAKWGTPMTAGGGMKVRPCEIQ
jgi:hypothetical protein